MNDTVICKKCGGICTIDGDFPKFYAWCDTCNDYADYDMGEYAADYLATIADGRNGVFNKIERLRINRLKDMK